MRLLDNSLIIKIYYFFIKAIVTDLIILIYIYIIIYFIITS